MINLFSGCSLWMRRTELEYWALTRKCNSGLRIQKLQQDLTLMKCIKSSSRSRRNCNSSGQWQQAVTAHLALKQPCILKCKFFKKIWMICETLDLCQELCHESSSYKYISSFWLPYYILMVDIAVFYWPKVMLH